jgi:hypothetical protein
VGKKEGYRRKIKDGKISREEAADMLSRTDLTPKFRRWLTGWLERNKGKK